MSTKRAFSFGEVKKKAEDYHGTAQFVRSLPDLATQGVKSVNLELEFEEGLKLSLALQSCLQNLNRYNRNTKEGRAMGLLLSIKTDSAAISVIEHKVRPVK